MLCTLSDHVLMDVLRMDDGQIMVGTDGDEFDCRMAVGQCFSHAKRHDTVLTTVHNGYMCIFM